MKKNIIKIFGLPKTGSNLLEKLLILNLENYVCQHGDYHPNYHYLGWKHGLPKNISVYDRLTEYNNELVYFIFTVRNFKDWQNSYFTNHFNSWEFPPYYFDMISNFFVYNTPTGPEIYKNIEEFYITYNTAYKEFIARNPDRAMFIDFSELQNNQIEIVEKISQKFNFKTTHSFIYEIRKKIDSGGRINDLF